MGHRRSLLQVQLRNADPARYLHAVPVGTDVADLISSSLLSDLDESIKAGQISLRAAAADDRLFLEHAQRSPAIFRTIHQSYYVLDLSTALLQRLYKQSAQGGAHHHDNNAKHGNSTCNKYLANLEHLLQCLRHNALNAIVHHYLKLVSAHILHWHDYWQYQKRIDEEWFAEWPNGQRPLSTTWPWNVKPSLLVLWGVCWMFYAFNGYQESNFRTTRNQSGAAQGQDLSGDFRTGQPGSFSHANTQAPTSSKLPPKARQPQMTKSLIRYRSCQRLG